MDRIATNHKNVVCPIIDNILADTLYYQSYPGTAVGGFDWSLTFRWKSAQLFNNNDGHNKTTSVR